ncbi:MAG: ABC transporter permease [Proteobacteria bacterium]|nr:ABC transporter permease [Pseudomonadota bacterium]
MPAAPSIEVAGQGGAYRLTITGPWLLRSLEGLDALLAPLPAPLTGEVQCDWSSARAVDLGAAWVLIQRLRARGADRITHTGRAPELLGLLERLRGPREVEREMPEEDRWVLERSVVSLGRWSVMQAEEGRAALVFFGRIFTVLGGVLRSLKTLRLNSVTRFVYETGITAIPIVAMIAFLISVIVAYLGAQQLTKFGADIFVVDLVTVAVLRELAVLLTAVIVAGRSGSAFAAEIGVMQINQETDALRSMGMNPVELLIVPRILGLMIALPLLTVIADAMGLAGGGLLSLLQLDIPWPQFVQRMKESIAPTTFWVGIIKAPVFAFLIAMVGTYRGMQVRNSARELGRLTTVAVVQAIFLVILADALFAILFVKLDI